VEQLISNVIINTPNFAALLLMLIWQRQTINSLLDNQQKLLAFLLTYIDHASGNKKPPTLEVDGKL
jgi:hypothetical protein